ncbi:MAG: hypothetical protein AAF485_00820 [Chloroflexota bacterium]
MSPKSSKSPANSLAMTPFQLAVLGGLTLLLCIIGLTIVSIIYLNWETFFDVPQEQVAVAPTEPEATISPSPTNTSIATATPLPTATLPVVEATKLPTPTATQVVAAEYINKDKIAEIIQFVEDIRQLSLPEAVPINFLTRRQLEDQWQEDAFDKSVIEAVKTQQEFYTALGLIEPDVDLVQAAYDSQTDIILGYYTPDEKVMYIIAESVNMFAQEEMTFAHEYVHALQDYFFDLSLILPENSSGDALLAARSLPEGDARFLEDLFTQENISQEQLEYNVYRYLFQEQIQLEGISPALGIFTYFPYTAGEYFVIYLFIEGGYSWQKVNEAYSNPPISSEQIMHPEKYLAGEQPVPVTLPDLGPTLGSDWQKIDENVLGEIGLLVWLIDQTDQLTAINAASGWDGDNYSLWINDDDQRVLVEQSVWESEAEAIEFLEAFDLYMTLREGAYSRSQEGSIRVWDYDEGITFLSRQNDQVLIVVAPDRTVLDQVRSQFGGF